MDTRNKMTIDAAAGEAGDTVRGPLSGVRVLDLSAYIAGPYGCTLLADMGAEVIKIEPPSGDNLRKYPSTLEAESRAFLGINRSKRGLVLDLKKPEGLAVLIKMLESTDVLVHNFRPSVPPRLGIDYERFRATHPRLIYCVVNGYGESGPMKDNAGYDQVLQSLTGICSMQGKHGHPPEIVYGSVVDYYAAAMVASGVSAALFDRERSGRGQYVGVSLLRSALAMQSARFVWADGEDRDVGRDMRSGGVTGLHPAREGFIYLSANTPHFWQALCRKAGLPQLAEDERYDTVRKRAEHANEILPLLHDALKAHTAMEWENIFWRGSAECGCAIHRRNVRSSAGAGRRPGRHARSSRGGPLQRIYQAGEIRQHTGPGAVRRADHWPAFGRSIGQSRLRARRNRTPARARHHQLSHRCSYPP